MDPLDRLNYYWDVLEFINWVKNNHPLEYEYSELENYYQHIVNFGYFYVKVLKPQPTPIIYEDGILSIGIPVEEMITHLYDYVINLNDGEATDLKVVLDSINLLRDTILKTNSGSIADVIFKERADPGIEAKIDTLIQRVNPTSEYKTKKENREAKAKAEIAKILLKK